MGLTWGFWDASIFDLNPNIILGADVFYDASGKICAFEILICSLLPIWFVGSSWNVVSGFAGKPLMTSLRPSHICSRVLQDQSSLRLIIIEGILISSVCSDCGLHDLLVMMFFFFPSSNLYLFFLFLAHCSGHHLIEFLMVKWGLKCVKLVDGFSFLPHYKARELNGNIQLAEIVLNHESPEVTKY